MKVDRQNLMLTEKNLYKAFIILATPVFLAGMLNSVHDLVDTYFIGQIESSVSAQAAISISWPIINLILAFNAGLAISGISIISRLVGAGKWIDAKKYAGTLLIFAVGLAMVLNVLLYVSAPSILHIIGAEGEVFNCALTYMRIRSFELYSLFIVSVFQAVRHSTGDTVVPVSFSIGAVIINIILTYIFVAKLGMGIGGAALSTLLGQVAMSPFILILIFKPSDYIFIPRKYLRIEKKYLSEIIKVAMPAALGQAFSALGFLVLNAVILDYGSAVVAGFSNGNKISSLILMPIIALSGVETAYISQNIGANNLKRGYDAYKTAKILTILISLGGGLLCFPLTKLFATTLSNDPDVIAISIEYMRIMLIFQFFVGLFQNYLGAYNGCEKTMYSMIISSARLWVIRLPLILILKMYTDMGRYGIWTAMMVSNVLIVVVGHLYFRNTVIFKNRKLNDSQVNM